MDAPKPGLETDFEGSPAPPKPAPARAGERVTVTLDIDADIWPGLKVQPLDWQREINNAARFVMEMSDPAGAADRGFYEAEFQEIACPDPARNADRIAHDFVP